MAIIEIKNLKKVFNNQAVEVVALQDVNIDVEKGEIFGIIGLSGAGKSTLVRMINYLEKPSEGKVLFEGKNLGELKDNELRSVRKEIGMIFQNFNLLEQVNVLKNIMFPLEISGVAKDKAIERARELLKLVDLTEKEREYPSKLSGGQKQRVAIARALATNPKVLLCDEATSALDPDTTNQILDLLKSLNEKLGLTIIIISHQMNVIERICNKVAIIDKAEIAESGNLYDVFLSPKTNIAKRIIYSNHLNTKLSEEKLIKLIFNGEINTPLIANIVQDCGIIVSIVYADSHVVDNKIYGQMIFNLPYYDKDIMKLKKYLKINNITYEEVDQSGIQ